MPRRLRPSFAALPVVAALLLSGCGGGGADEPAARSIADASSPAANAEPSGTDWAALDDRALIAAVRRAGGDVRTVHIKADLGSGADRSIVEMTIDRTQKRYTGTVITQGVTVEVRRTATGVHVREANGRWARLQETDSRIAGFDGFMTLADISGLLRTWAPGFTRTKETVDGVPVLTTTQPNPDGAGEMVVRLPGTGPAVPLSMRGTDPADPLTVTWSRVNEPVTVAEPSAGTVLAPPA